MNSLAMAYGMSKRKKMAQGGEMPGEMDTGMAPLPEVEPDEMKSDPGEGIIDRIMHKMAKGGEVKADAMPADFSDPEMPPEGAGVYTAENSGDEKGNEAEAEHRADIIARIMKQRSMKERNPRPA